MTAHGLKIIDSAIETTNIWVNAVDAKTGWGNKQRSYRLLRQVLHVIRDHLNVNEAAHVGAQLPVLLRGIYYEGWNPAKTPVIERTVDGLIAKVQTAFETDPLGDAPQAIKAVFDVMQTQMTGGEMEQVKERFSREIQMLF